MTSARSTSVPDVSSLAELLAWRAARSGEVQACTFLSADGSPAASWSYADLDRRAGLVARRLVGAARPGDRAILLYPPGLEYLAAFFGCLYAGVVAIPAYPPDPAAFDRSVVRLSDMVEDAGAAAVLADPAIHEVREEIFRRVPRLAALRWIHPGGHTPADGDAWRPHRAAPDDVAFLQYTSGSTGAPKGVMVSHGNLLRNFRCMNAKVGDRHECMVSWLPPYHDMGLIGGMLYPVAGGFPTVLMAPATFLKRPSRWLEAITCHRGTISPAPNFAYDLCVRKITEPQRARLDLRSWKVAINGAEPVRMDTLRRFSRSFASCGFRPETFTPCYGLAEGTLIVTGKPRGSLPRSFLLERSAYGRGRAVPATPGGAAAAVELASAGTPIDGHRVVIVDPTTKRRCPDREIGEVWVAGPWRGAGLLGAPSGVPANVRCRARAAGGARPIPPHGGSRLHGRRGAERLRTAQGRRHPERRQVPLVGRRGGPRRVPPRAAPGVLRRLLSRRGGEGAPRRRPRGDRAPGGRRRVFLAIRRRVQEVAALSVDAIVLVPPRTIPKTSSGKLQRHACRQALLSGALRPTAETWSARRRSALRHAPGGPPPETDGEP